jgi:anti-sigma B factor antagonist
MDLLIRTEVLQIQSARSGSKHVVELAGELDLAGSSNAGEELRRVEATDAQEIVLDVSKLTFIDAAGIRVLLEAEARSRSDSGRLRVTQPQRKVKRVLQLTGVDWALPLS